MSYFPPPGSFTHAGLTWTFSASTRPTKEETEARQRKQDACPHDSKMLLLTSPPMCPLCYKVMR